MPVRIDTKQIKIKIGTIIAEAGLNKRVTIAEVESAVTQNVQFYESPLLLGLVARLMERGKKIKVLELIPLLSMWNNAKESGNVNQKDNKTKKTPFNLPHGENEIWIMRRLFQNYERRLREKELAGIVEQAGIDVEMDFQSFQKDFLSMMPAGQPFADKSILMTHREIILEERHRLGWPKAVARKIEVSVSSENLTDKIMDGINHIEHKYMEALNDIDTIENSEEHEVRKSRLKNIFHKLLDTEPFMKCTGSAATFYRHFASFAYLCDATDMALKMAKKALAINPRHAPTRSFMKEIQAKTRKM